MNLKVRATQPNLEMKNPKLMRNYIMTTATATTTVETQIAIALEVLKLDDTGKTKKAIAEEYGVSPRSVTRYAEKYEEEAMDLLTSANESEEVTELKVAFKELAKEEREKRNLILLTDKNVTKEQRSGIKDRRSGVDRRAVPPETGDRRVQKTERRKHEGFSKAQLGCLERYYKQKADSKNMKFEERKGKTGRARKNVKTIRFITMEILEAHAQEGTLLKANKDDIIKEIAEAASTDEKTAKQYFSGHKKLFGDYQDK